MTENEWLELAEEYDRKAAKALAIGDESAAELWERKAAAARYCAIYGTVKDRSDD
jgi:hypothetical protein